MEPKIAGDRLALDFPRILLMFGRKSESFNG